MPLGPGKYDDICTYAREKANAQGALLIIIGGKDGEGFACQADLRVTSMLPTILRHIADEMEASLRQGKLP